MRLARGFPSIYLYFQEDFAQPHPHLGSPIDFLKALLQQLTGVEPQVIRLGDKQEPATWESWGRVGAADTWLTWRAWGIVDDSSAYTEDYQADLPTIRFKWNIEYLKSGYRHIPRHGALQVDFTDPGTERAFRRLWRDVFRQPAHFTRLTGTQTPDRHQSP